MMDQRWHVIEYLRHARPGSGGVPHPVMHVADYVRHCADGHVQPALARRDGREFSRTWSLLRGKEYERSVEDVHSAIRIITGSPDRAEAKIMAGRSAGLPADPPGGRS